MSYSVEELVRASRKLRDLLYIGNLGGFSFRLALFSLPALFPVFLKLLCWKCAWRPMNENHNSLCVACLLMSN